jgi:tyrosinase
MCNLCQRADAFASPSDPTFFLQHAYLDKLWWNWQEADPKNRTFAIGGPNNQDPATGFFEFPGTMADEARGFGEPSEEQLAVMPTGRDGDPGDVVTLDHVLTAFGYIPDATVRDIMDTRNGYLCFEYV